MLGSGGSVGVGYVLITSFPRGERSICSHSRRLRSVGCSSVTGRIAAHSPRYGGSSPCWTLNGSRLKVQSKIMTAGQCIVNPFHLLIYYWLCGPCLAVYYVQVYVTYDCLPALKCIPCWIAICPPSYVYPPLSRCSTRFAARLSFDFALPL